MSCGFVGVRIWILKLLVKDVAESRRLEDEGRLGPGWGRVGNGRLGTFVLSQVPLRMHRRI